MDTRTVLQRNNKRMKMKKKEVVPPEIGEDLIMEILLRLQPVSVLRFKCVSKSWYNLITHPSFFRNHAAAAAAQFHLLSQEPPGPGLLLSPTSDFPDYPNQHSVYTILPPQNQDQEPPAVSNSCLLKLFLDHSLPAFEQKFSDCFLIDSCNGLLLYRTDQFCTPNQYTLFNPITNQYKEVPLMNLLDTFTKPNEDQLVVFDHPHIVFDPSISLSYKLLAVMGRPSSSSFTHFQLYVYSFDDDHDIGSWRHLVNFDSKYITSGNTFMFNGLFFWLCHRHSICFDYVEETVWLFSLPLVPVECPNPDVLYFGECGGRIRLIQEYRDTTFACSFDIMEMELGSRHWTMKTRVNLGANQEDTSDPFNRVVVKVMHHYKTEKGEEVVLLNVDYKRVVSFNITTKTLGKVLTIPYTGHLDCLNAFPFTPTLYPLQNAECRQLCKNGSTN